MDKNIRLCIIANAKNDEGKIIYLRKFIDVINQLSQEVYIITGDFIHEGDDRIHVINIQQNIKVTGEISRISRFIRTQLVFSYNIIKLSSQVNVVLFFGPTSIIPLALSKFLNKKIIVIMGGSAWKGTDKIYKNSNFFSYIYPNILKYIEKIGLIMSDRIGVEGESAINFLDLANYKGKIEILRNMHLDLKSFRVITNINERDNLVGFISRLNEGKGALNFINSIPIILKERSDIEFLIVGDGALFGQIRDIISSYKLSNKVKLVGWAHYNEMPTYLNKIKLLVLPTLSDGTPSIVSESMACGSIVLSTPVGGIPDLVKDGKTGFLLESNDPACIARGVLRVLNYPDLDKIANNARNLIEIDYTYEANKNRFEKLLKDITN